jgi:dihydrofolate reductase
VIAGIRISLIAAAAENGVIGAGGVLPWRLSSDMKRFKRLTMGKPVIMGRKTYESIGKPLEGRVNIVVSRRPGFKPPGVVVAQTVEAALILAAEKAGASGDEEAMVIGGGEVYAAALSLADRLYITHVEGRPDGDTKFPPIEAAIWRATSPERLPASDKDSAATTFVVYERLAGGDPSG